MGFRERPEYQDWRAAVFGVYGRKCIRCGYAGNIHAHHIMPVEDYPELAFEPTNGVPLCGNCHTEIKGNELEHADDLKRLQRAVLGGEAADVISNAPNETELRERAYAEPSNAQAVQAWFHVTSDSQAVFDFYNERRLEFPKTGMVYWGIAVHSLILSRWQDVIEATDQAILCAEQEGILKNCIGSLAVLKSSALSELGRLPEAVAFLREYIGRFPDVASLHECLSRSLDTFGDAPESRDAREESVCHALKAAELAPKGVRVHKNGECSYVSWAIFLLDVMRVKGDRAAVLRYSKRALALPSTDEDRFNLLYTIARVYQEGNLYADARSYLREAMEIDDCSVEVITDIAFCYSMEGNEREALRMANRGLVLDPNNELCQQIVRRYSPRGRTG